MNTPRLALTCILFTGAMASGCATKPESIRPAYISELQYMAYTCDQLGQEQMRLVAALSTAADVQRRARSNDTMGVIFLGLPVSSLSGSNIAEEIARLKGELQALQKAAILKNCVMAAVADPTAKPVKGATKAQPGPPR